MLNSLPLVVRGGARQLLRGQSQVLAMRRQLWAAVLPTATPSSAMHAIAAMPPTAVPPRTALASATRRFHSHTSPLLAQQHGQQHGQQPAVHHPRTLRQRLSNGWDQTVKIVMSRIAASLSPSVVFSVNVTLHPTSVLICVCIVTQCDAVGVA
ncbi:hypothetical protein BC831DRAFT_464150 [Entophlyctis helioformis]|nr:hypothetical protein BC831DRAFT_464150 [Entophlyctis helioformis]